MDGSPSSSSSFLICCDLCLNIYCNHMTRLIGLTSSRLNPVLLFVRTTQGNRHAWATGNIFAKRSGRGSPFRRLDGLTVGLVVRNRNEAITCWTATRRNFIRSKAEKQSRHASRGHSGLRLISCDSTHSSGK